MGLTEAGAYIQEVRTLRRLSRQHVAARIGISDDRIEEFEKGRGKLNGPALLRLIHTIGASYEQVTALLDDASATVEQARSLAVAALAQPPAGARPPLSDDDQVDELFALALERTGGDRRAARQLLLRVLEETLRKDETRTSDA